MWKVIVMCTLLCVGCGGSTEPRNSAAGTYALISVDGAPVPLLFDDGLVQGFLLSGSIELKSSGAYVMTQRDSSYCASCGPSFSVEVQTSGGGWSLSGPALTLTDTSRYGGSPVIYTVNGNTIMSPAPGNWLYQKR